MAPLVLAHVALAVALLVAAAVSGVAGILASRRGREPLAGRRASMQAHALQLTHTLVFATGLLGLMLLADGRRAPDPLHMRVYGSFMVVAIVAAYGFRSEDARLTLRVFSVTSIVILLLGLRAVATGG